MVEIFAGDPRRADRIPISLLARPTGAPRLPALRIHRRISFCASAKRGYYRYCRRCCCCRRRRRRTREECRWLSTRKSAATYRHFVHACIVRVPVPIISRYDECRSVDRARSCRRKVNIAGVRDVSPASRTAHRVSPHTRAPTHAYSRAEKRGALRSTSGRGGGGSIAPHRLPRLTDPRWNSERSAYVPGGDVTASAPPSGWPSPLPPRRRSSRHGQSDPHPGVDRDQRGQPSSCPLFFSLSLSLSFSSPPPARGGDGRARPDMSEVTRAVARCHGHGWWVTGLFQSRILLQVARRGCENPPRPSFLFAVGTVSIAFDPPSALCWLLAT